MANEVRLIDANKAILNTYDEIYWTESEKAAVRAFLVHQPTIDTETMRPKGRWEDCDWVEYDGYDECVHYPHEGMVCTNCRNAFKKAFVNGPRVNYCPHCGADMRGDSE